MPVTGNNSINDDARGCLYFDCLLWTRSLRRGDFKNASHAPGQFQYQNDAVSLDFLILPFEPSTDLLCNLLLTFGTILSSRWYCFKSWIPTIGKQIEFPRIALELTVSCNNNKPLQCKLQDNLKDRSILPTGSKTKIWNAAVMGFK